MKQSLNGTWRLFPADSSGRYDIPAEVPGTLCGAMIKEKMLDNPYYRENELTATEISRESCVFDRRFDLDEELIGSDKILLKFYGIDTLSEVILNGIPVGNTDNMHREYVFDVTDIVRPSGNRLMVAIMSPTLFIEERNASDPLWGVFSTMAGYPHIRKAHYMFGWDWGPKLPDMGIWRDVELIGVRGGLIDSLYAVQDHSKISEGIVNIDLEIVLSDISDKKLKVNVILTDPDGNAAIVTKSFANEEKKKHVSLKIENPRLWYPRGYGEQPLYNIKAVLINEDTEEECHSCEINIGLRTVSISRESLESMGESGEEFAFTVNGLKIFAMGANYVPENQLIGKHSRNKTEKLLKQCCLANFNMIRVWGGGFYPDDYFYDLCDQMGLLVWQDFMFACSVYKADRDFCETVKREVIDNVKRIRNHPCLALWCGNNEIESMWQYWGIDAPPEYKKDYLRLFEVLIPKVLHFYDPVTFYWPSSPSSGGSFADSGSLEKGDAHYWAVWHDLKPFEEYYNYKFRFCSEFGFESLPSMKTIRTFAEKGDLNLCSPVMELHQKCERGTEKIMYYLAQMCHYPYSFEGLIYATQLVQADAVRLNVENMRRNRGVCMGSLYWQVNDSNPVISWSSIDFFHRWKALHYKAKHFYAPALLSCDGQNPDELRFNISSERTDEFTGSIRWRSRDAYGKVLAQGSEDITVPPLSAAFYMTLTPEDTKISPDMRDKAYIEYSLIEKGIRLSGGTYMFCVPKKFRFKNPKLSFTVFEAGNKFKIETASDAFAKGVFLDLKDGDCLFSDNWFDLHGETKNIYVSKANLPAGMTKDEFAENLTMVSYFEALGLYDEDEKDDFEINAEIS
ncbi:MAG: glycoside hydrolase family 2 protein [Oscillospiraceae bacterium]|nr:glycoside hydrolase family 2 protein [Oscillospiraceae bacterium]